MLCQVVLIDDYFLLYVGNNSQTKSKAFFFTDLFVEEKSQEN